MVIKSTSPTLKIPTLVLPGIPRQDKCRNLYSTKYGTYHQQFSVLNGRILCFQCTSHLGKGMQAMELERHGWLNKYEFKKILKSLKRFFNQFILIITRHLFVIMNKFHIIITSKDILKIIRAVFKFLNSYILNFSTDKNQ